jgi:hypothetical protein
MCYNVACQNQLNSDASTSPLSSTTPRLVLLLHRRPPPSSLRSIRSCARIIRTTEPRSTLPSRTLRLVLAFQPTAVQSAGVSPPPAQRSSLIASKSPSNLSLAKSSPPLTPRWLANPLCLQPYPRYWRKSTTSPSPTQTVHRTPVSMTSCVTGSLGSFNPS